LIAIRHVTAFIHHCLDIVQPDRLEQMNAEWGDP
jgi:hypothetical protein